MTKNLPHMRFVTYLTMLFLVICSSVGKSQTFEEYYEQQQKEYSEFKDQKEKEFRQYIEKKDKEFLKHLEENWDSFQMMRGKKKVVKPKPDSFPMFKDSVERKYRILEYDRLLNEMTIPEPKVRHKKTTEFFEIYRKIKTAFIFYGEEISIDHEDVNYLENYSSFSNTVIGNGWNKLNKAGFYNCIPQLLEYKTELNLNDWGYYLLVRKLSQEIASEKEYYKMLMWYILLKSEYNVRIGYTNSQLLLLVPFAGNIYEVPYYTIGNQQYYVFETENPGEIKSYIHTYPHADKPIEPGFKILPNFNNSRDEKTISHEYDGKKNKFNIIVNNELQAYYQTFPLMDLANYFNSPMYSQTERSLIENLRGEINFANEEESVHYLLHFAQHAFSYKTDNEQFGAEKVFFPDELFYYPFSDCEDRSVFFAYIVKKMLNLKVIGLEFSDHIAVAVNFSNDIEGNYVNWEGDKYVVCDPTYMNAPIGMILPKHLDSEMNIIKINN